MTTKPLPPRIVLQTALTISTTTTITIAATMPAFHDTWLSPNISIPPISTGADHNHHDRSTSGLQICRLCSDGFHTENNLSHTRARSPCADLSCTGCTWLWRNGDSACRRCVARFPCPFRAPASGSAGVDGLPSLSYRVLVPDEGYEGGDERGIIAKVGNFPSAGSTNLAKKVDRRFAAGTIEGHDADSLSVHRKRRLAITAISTRRVAKRGRWRLRKGRSP
ncbi:hypothetical protein HO173_010894 [Letharia columbiana]|uniref:Uncharacterized protein n=1 Tax=Letharia columbiana TaxID=112416 RepID=A0A8H6FLL8_9LECA|nr:uncharacterized protein HO173_010894 [Letharia columbiana]KAF6230778.1 hypothetical protein HO173_010894 [Letharia columbiana]